MRFAEFRNQVVGVAIGVLAAIHAPGAEYPQTKGAMKPRAWAPGKPQYQTGDLVVPPASITESTRETVSPQLAEQYLQTGALAWKRTRNCVSCHTTGTYVATRPSLTEYLGAPHPELRELCVQQLEKKSTNRPAFNPGSTYAGEVVYIAAGLAEWDRHVTRTLSPETKRALSLMFEIQLEDGSWHNPGCWPPLESDAFHLAGQAALAIAAAPGWLQQATEGERAGVERLKKYLRTTPPPHDYAAVWLLRAAAQYPDLLPAGRREELIGMIARQQQADGGWSLRTFAKPEEWGNGFRGERLRTEFAATKPASDGHQTGLVIVALREAGVPASDPRIQRGLAWLASNQRESGRWWTRSLNTDTWHFITYSGTAYPLLALALCDKLPSAEMKVARGVSTRR